MLIYNIKLNKKKILKSCLAIMLIIVISIGIVALYNVLNSLKNNNDNNFVEDSIPSNDVAVLKPENYTNVLKEVHENIDTYIGQKISFSGYVYRISGFSEDQFVLARDMDIGNKQTLIVGFLCSSDKATKFESYSWISVTGEITKGTYNNTNIPILKITEIQECSKPENANVPVPDDAYVPTAVIY